MSSRSMVCLSVCLSVCPLVSRVNHAKTAEPFEMPFGIDSRLSPKNRVLIMEEQVGATWLIRLNDSCYEVMQTVDIIVVAMFTNNFCAVLNLPIFFKYILTSSTSVFQFCSFLVSK